MGAEKAAAKGGGSFFHLFDWNRKSRKKLFSNSPEGSKQGKRSDDNLPVTRLHLVDEDEIVGVTSVKGSSDYSCASSVTDEEGNGARMPGVVARLMGLDSLPTSGVSEPHSTPLNDSRSLRDNYSQKRSPEFYIDDKFGNLRHKAESYSPKPTELRAQKVPSSPIERFQTETLPPRSAKSLPITHNKLLSPIKNLGFISAKTAAHVMEAAVKIIEPGLQANAKSKPPQAGSSSVPIKLRDPRENLAASQRMPRPMAPPKRPVELTTVKYLRGQPLDRSWDGSEDVTFSRPTTSTDETNSAVAKGRGKSISLAIQAKVNVQRREGLSTSSNNRSTLVYMDQDESKLSQPIKSQTSSQKNKLQRKATTSSASGVLRQNDKKQNCARSNDRLASKQPIANQQGRKVLSRDASSGKSKISSKIPGNSKVVYRKESAETSHIGVDGMSSNHKNFPRKKRLIEGSSHVEKGEFNGNLLDKHEKLVQSNVLIDEHSCLAEDRSASGSDVVSFTFTSPMIKPMPGNGPTSPVVKRWDKRKAYNFDAPTDKTSSDAKHRQSSSLGSNVISGDALSLLLEQKLRELTSTVEPSNSSPGKAGSFASSTPDLQESAPTYDTLVTVETRHEKEYIFRPCKDSLNDSGLSSIDGQMCGMRCKLQEEEVDECSSSSNNNTYKEPDHQNPSPLSVLEASFSNESFVSSECCSESPDGSKACSSSVQAQDVAGLSCLDKKPSLEPETELSDSASSAFKGTVGGGEHAPVISSKVHKNESKQDLEYVREIISNSELQVKDLGLCHLAHAGEILGPLLFNKLEYKGSGTKCEEWVVNKVRRKALFDCMKECLGSKCGLYFQAGYRTWAKGVAVVGENLAEELYKEILAWEDMGDWMVDELVDKDMSSNLGSWVDFEIEAFETGAEIEREIVCSLIDEMVADFLVRGPCV